MNAITLVSMIALSCVLMLPSCNKSSTAEIDDMRSEAERVTLSQKVRLLNMRIEMAGPSHDEVLQMSKKADELKDYSRKLRDQKAALSSSILQSELEFADYKKKSIAMRRSLATGKTYEVFTTTAQTYQNARIDVVNDIGIEISHATGKARVKAAQLSPEQLEQFGISVEQSRALLASEAVLQKKYENAVEQDLVMHHQMHTNEATHQNALRAEQRRNSLLMAKYHALTSKSTLSKTPQSKVYRVRSRPSTSFYYNYGYTYGQTNVSRGQMLPMVAPNLNINPDVP